MARALTTELARAMALGLRAKVREVGQLEALAFWARLWARR